MNKDLLNDAKEAIAYFHANNNNPEEFRLFLTQKEKDDFISKPALIGALEIFKKHTISDLLDHFDTFYLCKIMLEFLCTSDINNTTTKENN